MSFFRCRKMPLHSDLTIDSSKFIPAAISERTSRLNQILIKFTENGPKWWEVGPEKYRQMRWNGETALPKPLVISSGRQVFLPSRDSGRSIPCRVFSPEKGESKGLYLHIHGGGWVLQSEQYQDMLLKFIADTADLTVVSVGYRLAPEYPFPAGPNDCYDVAEYLVDHGTEEFGSNLKFAGGESAGGHLAALTFLHLLEARPSFEFHGLIFAFSVFDLTNSLPQTRMFSKELVLTRSTMEKYYEAFLPNAAPDFLRDPSVSPLFADLRSLAAGTPKGRLPPALFLCGTQDLLLDDTVLMSAKWQMTGAEAVAKIYPGAPHGFTLFDSKASDAAEEGRNHMTEFLTTRLNHE